MADQQRPRPTPSIAESIAATETVPHVAVTFDHCGHVEGPFFHGTRAVFEAGDRVVAGQPSNFKDGYLSNHVYFTALVEPAIWGAELATALAGSDGRGHIYVVEPTGPFEDDPNVTNKRFSGNPTRSYRTRHPMRVISEVHDWEGHTAEAIQNMLNRLAHLRRQGLDLIED